MIIIYNFVNFLIVSVIFGVVITTDSRDEYKWWCGDPECKAPIGEGISKSNYIDENTGQLFKKNEKILVLRKTIPPPEKGLLWIQLKSNGKQGKIPQNLIHIEKVNVKDENLLLFEPQTSTPIIHSSSTEVYDGTTLVDKQNDEGKHIYSPATSTGFTSSDSTVVPNPLASISEPPSVSPIESKLETPTYKADEGSSNSTNIPVLDPRDDSTAPHEDHVSDSSYSTDGVFNPISPTSFTKSIETGGNTPEFNSTDPNSETRIESTRNLIVREDDSESELFSDSEPKSSQSEANLPATTSVEPVHKSQVELAKNQENNNLGENKSSHSNYHQSPSGDGPINNGSINSEVMNDNSLPESSSMTSFQNTYNYMHHENKIGNDALTSHNVRDSPSDVKSSSNEITNSVPSIENNSPESSTKSPFQNSNTSEYQGKQIGNDTQQNPNVPASPSYGKSSDNQFAESAPKLEINSPEPPAKSPFQNVYSHMHHEKKIENETPEQPNVPNSPSNEKSSDNEITYSTSDMKSLSEPSYTLSTKNLQPAELQKSQENNESGTSTPSSDDPHVVMSVETSNSMFTFEGSLPQLTVPAEGPLPTPGAQSEALPTNSSEQIAESLKDSSLPFAGLPVQFTPDTLPYGGRKEVDSSVGQLEPENLLGTPPAENINSPLEEPSSEFPITESSTTESTSSEKTFTSDETPISEVSQPSVDSEKTESPSAENEKDERDQVESEVFEENSIPWYSSIVDNLQSIFSSEKEEIIHESIPTLSTNLDHPPMCQADDCFSQNQPKEPTAEDPYGEWLSLRSTIIIIITTVAVIIFSLGYYYIENLRRDTELISKYNDLSGKLFIEQTEKEMLSKQLIEATDSLNQISTDSSKNNKEIEQVKAQLKFYKDECATLTEKEKETSKKFMMVDKNYNELRKILSQTKQKGERSALIADIKTLKDSIEANNIEIASLKEQLLEKKEEIKALNNQIIESRLGKEHLEKTLEETITDGHKQVQQFQESIAQLEKIIEENAASHVTLEQECTQLKKEKESLTLEKELVESSLQKFQRLQPGHSLKEWLNAKEVRVALLAAEKKVQEMTIENSSLLSDKNQLEDKLGMLTGDLKQLDEKYETAEKEKIEALTKLQVLSDYFKEKETQLQEELGSKESLWLQKQSDDRTIYEQMRALREENASFKNQNETLKREILEQEASFKKLITSAEEKAHENWVALRHHERRLKEAHMEASQLRSRLTALESTGDNGEDKIGKDEVNGDIPPFGSATSPPFMLYPEFLPPPPLVSATPSRPPPLGRISSPPLDDFTPPPPLVPYEMFLPQSPPPPHQHGLPHVVHKPQPLERNHRVQKDSQSSNHSSESGPDKPRRNKR